MEDKDLDRALRYLETLEVNPETEQFWKVLGKSAILQGNLFVAEHCYAVTGDVSTARFLQKLIQLKKSEAMDDMVSF
jgi:hypothetical protein